MNNQYKLRGLKSFFVLWGSQAVSSLGSAMTNYALIIWVYRQRGTVTSVALLSFFTYLPSILFCFIAGTLADKWDKKRIMLVSDSVAAMGTLTVFLFFSIGRLEIWHLYAVNFVISLMNAFQNPASYVAVSLLAPKDQYVRVAGLQTFSNSLVTVFTPALASAVLAFAGLKMIFIIDLTTFFIAFLALLFFIKIPSVKAVAEEEKSGFLKSCLEGLGFLRAHKPVFQLILFFSFINLIAYMTGFGILPAMILARTGDNQATLGLVSSCIGFGTLTGSILVTALKPPKRKAKVVFLSCGVSFLICNILWAVSRNTIIWVLAAFFGNLPLPFLSANLTTIMRTKVPMPLQGRVFATRDTIQFCTIPLGLFLGGYLADNVFEPFMAGSSPFSRALSLLVGTGDGAGIALMFLLTGIMGAVSSFLSLKNKAYKTLDA